ncbi:uncharacterized protein LOC143282691 [Babylonia areolata]|uniref:uncharacterized protein LOC143282691 n=1 Tax=Babylonia areolata TaxID=304850 RepID=UPI003FD62C3F
MSVQQLPAHTAQAAHHPHHHPHLHPSFPHPDDGDVPLPDHFPEPYYAADGQHRPPGSAPAMVVPCPGQQAVENLVHGKHPHYNDNNDDNDAREEGVRRITGKYAAPAMLYVNGSRCSSSDARSPSVSPIDTWPASSPSASTTTTTPTQHSGSPPTSSGFSSSGSPVMSSSRHAMDPATPKSHLHLPTDQQQQHHRLAPLSISAFSDASSDMSDASPSPAPFLAGGVGSSSGVVKVGGGRYQSVCGIALTASLAEGVTDEDVQQVEMFYRSHKSEVTVCRSLANLYFGSVSGGNVPSSAPASFSTLNGGGGGVVSPAPSGVSELWEFVTTGIPVLVLDSGDHVRARQLSLVVAEKGTGFVLWKDVVSHLTDYACPHANFHTLHISSSSSSSDGSKLAGLSFDDSQAAASFAAALLKLTSDPDDELLMLSKKGKKKKKKKKAEGKKKAKFKPPKKTDISQPCCFQHVTKLERPQVTGLTPLTPSGFPPSPSGFPPSPSGFPQAPSGGSVSSLSDVFQDRLTVSDSRARSPSSELSDASAGH